MSDSRLSATASGRITIDMDALAGNWRALARRVAPAECAAVVKADAYGLGDARVIPALAAAGCRTFFIATPDEAHRARRLAPTARVFVLDGLFPGASGELLASGSLPCLASFSEVQEWSECARRIGARLACALHIDSGLNRLGLSLSEVDALVASTALLDTLDVQLVMSHLASADDPQDLKNEAQRAQFDRMRARLPAAPASLAASDGLMLGAAYHYDLVRPGYALYGGQAFRGAPSPVAPVVTVEARVLQVRDVGAGETVGYSGTWRARRPSRIAIIAAGYADGFARAASTPGSESGGEPGASVLIHGLSFPIAGRVSMDLITVDVTDAPRPVARGDTVRLLGPDLSLETAGAQARTIGYEVLTRLGQRFERVYLGGPPPAGES